MSQFADYLIVGAGVAGGHAAFEIRKRNKNGKIIMVAAEKQPPYDRVPMSKEYLAGKRKKSELFFRADSYYRRNKIELIREHEVKAINTSTRLATMDDGSEIEYRVALLATGGRVRKLQLPASDLAGIFYLRTLQECDAIRAASKSSKNAVIIGGGFIGCEVAATLRSKGLNVTLVELAPQLLGAAIDEKTAGWIKDYHVRKGVNVLTSTSISGFQGRGGHITEVELKGGKTIDADFAVVGVGIAPNTELGEAAGLKTDRGIVVDQYLKTSVEGVYAAGDVARFYSPIFKRYLRVEHYDVAEKHGTLAGMNMTGEEQAFNELPYFFSNQYDLEINAYGDLSQHDTIIQRGSMDSESGFFQFYVKAGILNGILSVNADWDDIERAKKLVESQKELVKPSLLSDESMSLESMARQQAREVHANLA